MAKDIERCSYNSSELKKNFKATNKLRTTVRTKGGGGGKGKPPKGGGAYTCFYIDFDGETIKNANWNGGQTLTLAPAELTTEQKAQVMMEVRAHFSPYNVVITDDITIYNAANVNKRMRVIVTPTSGWYPGVTGVAYTGSLTWGDNTPCFVFSDKLYNGAHYIAEIIAHELGHTVGLRHQGEYNEDCSLKYTYKMGVVMGNSLYVPQGEWIYGTTTCCTCMQDDKAILASVLGLAPVV